MIPDSIAIPEGAVIAFRDVRKYEIDLDRVRTLDDVVAILKGLQITVHIEQPPTPQWAAMLPYLKEIT